MGIGMPPRGEWSGSWLTTPLDELRVDWWAWFAGWDEEEMDRGAVLDEDVVDVDVAWLELEVACLFGCWVG